MPAESLNHYTIQARDVEKTKDFYEQIVGLKVGDRPPLNFPGLLAVLRRHADGAPARLPGARQSDPRWPVVPGGNRPARSHRVLLHRPEGHEGDLQAHSIKYDERVLPRLNMTQLFYLDPDGIAVECNFPAAETETRAAAE